MDNNNRLINIGKLFDGDKNSIRKRSHRKKKYWNIYRLLDIGNISYNVLKHFYYER